MSNRIITKHDVEILQAASKVLEHLSQEYSLRFSNLRKSTIASTYQEYWNAKRKLYYFMDACNRYNIKGLLCNERMILVG